MNENLDDKAEDDSEDRIVHILESHESKRPKKLSYKQAYRPAWESMPDFRGWLQQGTKGRAFCYLCQKELHCHRISLMKHKITIKHQRREEEQRLEMADELYNEKAKAAGRQQNSDGSNPYITSDSDGDCNNLLCNKTCLKYRKSKSTEPQQSSIGESVSYLSTHVLDTTRGVPGGSVPVVLYKLVDSKWTMIDEGITNSTGRFEHFTKPGEFTAGRFKLHFDVGLYFNHTSQATIFPFIEVVFDVTNPTEHYHIPLLLNPYGYSTYKGS